MPTLSYESGESAASERAELANSRCGLASFLVGNFVIFGCVVALWPLAVLDAIEHYPIVLWGGWGISLFAGIPLALAGFTERWRGRRLVFAGLAINAVVATAPMWGRLAIEVLGL